jgi:hypothetical protein
MLVIVRLMLNTLRFLYYVLCIITFRTQPPRFHPTMASVDTIENACSFIRDHFGSTGDYPSVRQIYDAIGTVNQNAVTEALRRIRTENATLRVRLEAHPVLPPEVVASAREILAVSDRIADAKASATVAALTARAETAENSATTLQAQLEDLQRAFAEQQSEAATAKESARQTIHDLELRGRAFESALMAEKARVDEVRNATTLLEAAHDAERLHWTSLFAKQRELTSIADDRLAVAEASRS